MTFPSDGSFVPIFKSPDNAIMESDPEAGTSATESTDAESVAAGGTLFCKLFLAEVTTSTAGEVDCLPEAGLTSPRKAADSLLPQQMSLWLLCTASSTTAITSAGRTESPLPS